MPDEVQMVHATGISMNDRFSLLAGREIPDDPPSRFRRSLSPAAFRQGFGLPQPTLRRHNQNFGGMRRANSFDNLSQGSFGQRSWNSFGKMRRSASFSNLSEMGHGRWQRGFRRRGNPNWRFRVAFKSYRPGQFANVMGFRRGGGYWSQYRGQRRARGNMNIRGVKRIPQQQQHHQPQQQRQRQQQRQQQQQRWQNPTPTREELDQQLEEYMASSKYILDRQLEEYMRTADMEMESQ